MDQTIEGQLNEVIVATRELLPSGVATTASELVSAREWGVALELLCDELAENDICIPKAVLGTIERLGREMGLAEDTWQGLSIAAE